MAKTKTTAPQLQAEEMEFTPQYPRAPSFLSINPSKTEIAKVADDIHSLIESGEAEPLKIAVALKALEELTKQARERIESLVLDEVSKYNGKASIYSASVETMESGVKYDYSSFSKWNDLNAQAEAAINARKAFEDDLRKIPEGMQVIDEETGEQLTRPNKSSKTTYKITLSK